MTSDKRKWGEITVFGVLAAVILWLLLRHVLPVSLGGVKIPDIVNPGVVFDRPPPFKYSPDNITLNGPTFTTPAACACGCDDSGFASSYNAIANSYADGVAKIQQKFIDGLSALVPESISQYYNRADDYAQYSQSAGLFGVDPSPSNTAIDSQSIWGQSGSVPYSRGFSDPTITPVGGYFGSLPTQNAYTGDTIVLVQ